ncbi:MAG: hypothetical protein K5639_01185 [Eubacterium sp.]|nr:hypothetical protein [Eubacterium sp.]
MLEKRIMKKGVAAVLAFALSFSFVCQPTVTKRAEAASSKTEYVKEIKLFVKEGKSDEVEKEAKEWCESHKDENWHCVGGDLNKGGNSDVKSDMCVYMLIRPTTDEKEAIRDIAVMNEKGNYSEAEYKGMIEQQKELYKELIADMKDMLEEYRKNVTNKVPTALQTQKYLNGYVEDDSRRPLGDFLMDISDEDLVPVLMQANGKVVLMIQERLAYACDTAKTTWLERMEKLGSFEKLRSKALTAYNNNTKNADKALDLKYKDKAEELSRSWNDIKQHISHAEEYSKKQNIGKMSETELEKWFKNKAKDEETQIFKDEFNVINKLANYKYEDKTLLDFFKQDYKDVSGKDLKKLYPLVACLSTGQQAGVNESVSLFTMVMNAAAAEVFNDFETDKTKEIKKTLSADDKKVVDNAKEIMNESLDSWEEKNTISIYDGVDREIYKDGVAVTSAAKTYSSGVERSWADALIESSYFMPTAIGTAVGAAAFATGAIIAAHYYSKAMDPDIIADEFYIAKNKYNELRKIEEYSDYECGFINGSEGMENVAGANSARQKITALQEEYREVNLVDGGKFATSANQTTKGKEQLLQKAYEREGKTAPNLQLMRGLKLGFTIAATLLAVADIVVTGVALYEYYHRDHLPIPHHMVDLSFDENKETSYINYRSVYDQDGNYGDLNGGGGKQWLAVYTTTDKDAGAPILASDAYFVYQTGDNSAPDKVYSPLHMFGTPNVAQNLTFADGENGWSFNDKEGGVYLFFQRDAFYKENAAEGTALSGGLIVLIGIGGVFVGFILAIVFMSTLRRKEKKA